ncbi:hypothetical protein G210_4118 [Candida maltosa Xu316]|uniref:Uncharacterized protein n=1 Tax=Candida maltosa (strain Xu316) TaxID=1245528 RepID=M3IHA7_CANMX|nr:hypothetical protein G210_4118 [Candida maltosa Xu316]
MHPSAARLAKQVKVVPQYKYYIRRIPHFALWMTGIATFFGWPHVWADVSNRFYGAENPNRGFFPN